MIINEQWRSISNSTLGFRFVVSVNGAAYGIFTECQLPTISWDTKEIKEGGLNSYTHILPGRREKATITFKNGVGTGSMLSWYMQVMNEEFDSPDMSLRRNLTVTLLNSRKASAMAWEVNEAMPIKWSGPQLQTGENSVAIQTLELSCGEVVVVPGESI